MALLDFRGLDCNLEHNKHDDGGLFKMNRQPIKS